VPRVVLQKYGRRGFVGTWPGARPKEGNRCEVKQRGPLQAAPPMPLRATAWPMPVVVLPPAQNKYNFTLFYVLTFDHLFYLNCFMINIFIVIR
jgi:hypothetical protein